MSAATIGGGGGYTGGGGDKSLKMSLVDTLRLAWADPDLRARIQFVLFMFAVFALGVHTPVPVPGIDSTKLADSLQNNQAMQMLNMFGGGALKKVSVFSLEPVHHFIHHHAGSDQRLPGVEEGTAGRRRVRSKAAEPKN